MFVQRHRVGILFFLFVCLISASTLFAETEPPDQARSRLKKLLDDVHYTTLENGLRVIMYRRPFAPVFSGSVSIRVGGVDETLGKTGASHLLEHMAFKGTSTLGTRDYSKEKPLLEELEALMKSEMDFGELSEADQQRLSEVRAALQELWVGGAFSRAYKERGASGMNATTAKELTRYFVNLPRGAFEFWCWIESERILDTVMRQFYKERSVVFEERRMRYEDNPGGKLYENLLGVAFLRHPYRNPVIGYEADLHTLTASDVKDLWKRYYVPGNMVVSIVGDVNPEQDIETVRRYFGRMKPAPVPELPQVLEPDQQGERRLELTLPASPELAVVYRKPQYPDPDDPPLSVMLEILGGSRISPLYTELVKKRKLAVDIDYFEAPGVAYPNVVMFSGTVRAPHTNKQLLKAFDQVIQRFKRGKISPAQVEIAKRRLRKTYLEEMRSNRSLALHFASSELIYGNYRATLDWYDKVMAVTEKDVLRVAQKYLVDTSRTVGFIEKAS